MYLQLPTYNQAFVYLRSNFLVLYLAISGVKGLIVWPVELISSFGGLLTCVSITCYHAI
jgi:hypothetical protein